LREDIHCPQSNDSKLVGPIMMMNSESNANGRVTRVSDNTSRAPRMFGSDLVASSLPSRGLLYSLLVHGLLVAAFVYVPWSSWLPSQARLVTAQSMIRTHEVLLMPALEPRGSGGSAASSTSSADSKSKEDAASSSEAKTRQGVVYKGPQVIVSDPSHPDNFVQTIRQPSLVAPRLPAPLPLPAMISIASVQPELAPQPAPDAPPETKPIKVAASEPLMPRVEAPKLSLPPATSSEALVHAVVADAAPTPMPKLAHQEAPAKIEKKERNILVVNAFSVPAMKPPPLPPGELYGTFTISPAGATSIGLAGGGVEAKGAPGIGNASAAVTTASTAGAATTPNAGVGTKPSGGSGEGKAVRASAAPGTGTGHGSNGSGNETGAGSGAGLHTSGNGTAPGTGFGSSPFPAIIIQGGSAGGGQGVARALAGAAKPGGAKPQTSYAMTIVASGASGGGFKDYGVFRDEASYTVYLDMADSGARSSDWTLQYALDSHSAAPSSMASRGHGQIVPPYATLKSLPSFSPEVAKRGHGGTIVVFGVINRQGKFEDLRIMHTPDIGFNQLMLDALKKWTFRPAEMDGAQVSVKILLGVPVDSVPEGNSSVQIGSTRGVSHEAARF
jgi:hypothetical protein